ncbi:MAG: hypothetical protein JSS66_11225 [Armatimonadetes bacterium]|nr:hypothetical protein [Armatimonadota bacterium]
MRLKVLTTTLLIFGVLLLIVWPFTVGAPPVKSATRRAKVVWATNAWTYFTVTASTWVAVAASAVLLARQARREFLTEERKILQGLVEGSLKDHGKRD